MTPQIGFVSTYQPTNCGIATFSSSLMNAINVGNSYATKVVRLVEKREQQDLSAPEVIATMVAGDARSIERAAIALNNLDVALIQHEFGIYGGEDGAEVLTLVSKLVVPTIVVLHTVLSAPSAHQRSIIVALCDRAAAVVVMSKVARNRLIANGSIDASKIFLIHHGARRILTHSFHSPLERPIVLTWGLISPGKGIEWVIRAMGQLGDITPAPIYIVAGRTHPKVMEHEGESYRNSLQLLIADLALENSVKLWPEYLSSDALDNLIASSSMVVLPYDNSEQVTSGVLVEAVSAGRPIIATRFPHAVELLEGDVGSLVAFRNPSAISEAIRRILVDPGVAEEMSRRTSVIAKVIQWPTVARQYMQLATSLTYSRVSA